MNIDRPHEIVRDDEPPKNDAKSVRARRWIRLTEAEAAELETKSADERAAWLAALPTTEYLARTLEAEGLEYLAKRARAGEFDDYHANAPWDSIVRLDRELRSRCRYDLSRRVRAGEFDGTKAESDAWAKQQTGDTRAMLDAMERRARP